MLFSAAMRILPSLHSPLILFATLLIAFTVVGCKRSEPPPDLLKTQRDAMERAKTVGKTMQKAVDEEGKRADEEGK